MFIEPSAAMTLSLVHESQHAQKNQSIKGVYETWNTNRNPIW